MSDAVPPCCCCGCCCCCWVWLKLLLKNDAPPPNEGAPVEFAFRPNGDGDELSPAPPAPKEGVEVEPPNAPPVGFPVVENIDARNGFACGAVPVACGRRPTPSDDVPSPVACPENPGKPVGWEPSVEPGLDGGGDVAGVEGLEAGMGGSDSRRAAPNEDDGLNALRPLNPVVCGRNGALPAEEMEMEGAVVEVAPVGCEESDEKRESENVEPDVVLDVGWEVSGEANEEPGCDEPPFESENAKEEAMLAMTEPFAPVPLVFGCDPEPLEPKLPNDDDEKAPVGMGCCCCCACCPWALFWFP